MLPLSVAIALSHLRSLTVSIIENMASAMWLISGLFIDKIPTKHTSIFPAVAHLTYTSSSSKTALSVEQSLIIDRNFVVVRAYLLSFGLSNVKYELLSSI